MLVFVLLHDCCTERDIFVSQFLPLIRTRSYHNWYHLFYIRWQNSNNWS